MKEGQSQNFGLTHFEFEQMIEELRQGGGQLFEKVFLSHFRDCMTYLEKNCSASYEDAYDASMETLIQFRQLLIEGKLKYQNLRFLFTRMAVQWYWRWKKSTPPTDPVEGIEPTEPLAEYDEESIKLLGLAWAKLGENCQRLLRDFYCNRMALVDIAKQLDQTDATLRQRKKRCVEQLREWFFKISS